jgi:hypothetical protein
VAIPILVKRMRLDSVWCHDSLHVPVGQYCGQQRP